MESGGWEGEQTEDNTHLPVSNTIVSMPGPRASAIWKSQCTAKANPRYKPAFVLAHHCVPRDDSMAERNGGRISIS